MDSREQDHIKKMLRMHKRRLYALELQQAWHGINTSPEILMEIEDLKENIERFQSQIDAFPQIDDAGRESGESQGAVFSTVGRKQIEITFNGSFDDLTPEKQNAVVRAIAGIVEISPDQVTVLKVMPGSMIFTIELPAEAVDNLIELYESGDKIINLLDIERIRLTSEQDLSLSILVENAVVEQEKYFAHLPSDDRFSNELFRRAVVGQNEPAKKALVYLYSNLVKSWLKRWQVKSRFDPVEKKDIDELVNTAFKQFWLSLTPSKFEQSQSRTRRLDSILRYLHWSANGVIAEYIGKRPPRYLRDLSFAEERPDDLLQSDEFRELIRRKAKDEKEYLAVFASAFLGLSPREILEEYSDRFESIHEIYQSKASFLERLGRDEDSEIYDYIIDRKDAF